jgi:hypothetical protein
MKIMLNHNSAQQRNETPHTTISDALKRRARSLLQDKSIDANARAVIRYGLEINDPWLSELVRRADAGEPIIDMTLPEAPKAEDVSTEEKTELLAEIICQDGNGPAHRSAALLILIGDA